MRSGSQTFSRNQYAPIYGEREGTALNPGAQPAVERSKSDREGHKCARIEGSIPPNGPAFSRRRGTTARQATNEREAKLQADGRKEESYYFEPAKISLGAFS